MDEITRKISEDEFQDTLFAQIQILNGIQSRSKSIVNLTLAILAVVSSIISVTDIPVPSIQPTEEAVAQAAEASVLSEPILSILISTSIFGFLFTALFLFFSIFYSYLYIVLSFRTPQVRPFLGDEKEIKIKLSENINKEEHESWLQNNNELIRKIGSYYQKGVQGLAISGAAGLYAASLYSASSSVIPYLLVALNCGFILLSIFLVISSIIGKSYKIIFRNSSIRSEVQSSRRDIQSLIADVRGMVPTEILFTLIFALAFIIIPQAVSLYFLSRYLIQDLLISFI